MNREINRQINALFKLLQSFVEYLATVDKTSLAKTLRTNLKSSGLAPMSLLVTFNKLNKLNLSSILNRKSC